MTTNHVEKLDKALIRPGRVDKTVKFSLADASITISMFENLFAGGDADPVIPAAMDDTALCTSKGTLDVLSQPCMN